MAFRLTSHLSTIIFSLSFLQNNSPISTLCRNCLDDLGKEDTYDDDFTVTLHVCINKQAPLFQHSLWQGFSTKEITPDLLFLSQTERRNVVQQFGELFYININLLQLKNTIVFHIIA